jgi:hypothetical protein
MLIETLATGAALGGLGALSSYKNNERNIAMQRETNEMNERLTRENWGREDNAVQRRKADLVAAGLSPVLAAGSAAQSSAPIKMDSPKSEDWGASATGTAMQSVLAASQVSKTHMDNQRTAAEIGNIRAQTENTSTNTIATEQNMEQQLIMNKFQQGAISASTMRDQLNALDLKYELERKKKLGLSAQSSPIGKALGDVGGMVGAFGNQQHEKGRIPMMGGVGAGEGPYVDPKTGHVYNSKGRRIK